MQHEEEDELVEWLIFDCVQLVKSICLLWYRLSLSLVNQGWPKTKRLRWKLKSRTHRNPVPMIRKKQPVRQSIDITKQSGFDFYTETGLFIEQFESIFKAIHFCNVLEQIEQFELAQRCSNPAHDLSWCLTGCEKAGSIDVWFAHTDCLIEHSFLARFITFCQSCVHAWTRLHGQPVFSLIHSKELWVRSTVPPISAIECIPDRRIITEEISMPSFFQLKWYAVWTVSYTMLNCFSDIIMTRGHFGWPGCETQSCRKIFFSWLIAGIPHPTLLHLTMKRVEHGITHRKGCAQLWRLPSAWSSIMYLLQSGYLRIPSYMPLLLCAAINSQTWIWNCFRCACITNKHSWVKMYLPRLCNTFPGQIFWVKSFAPPWASL